ncbi:hypothetical protein [Chamaesiphon sp. GL140_3_metabinner_50]|uniref:hypothetical protein n=1 Tax=Chamaesiphon sp. GL140_3_metabinner_50 TaxID=2970812 RepID=UPI0025D13E48|nr:hypothetical protein [Chamaesiphon sp. GL140_3_metabinner_50]
MINRHSSITTAWVAILVIASCLNTAPSEARQMPKLGASPKQGKVLQLTNGDLMCYVQLVDARGRKYDIGADFDICQQTKFINRKVTLTYKRGKVNDCQSAAPCGKTRTENLIVKMKLVNKK